MSGGTADGVGSEVVVGSHALAVGGFAALAFAILLSALSIGLPSIVVAPPVVLTLTFVPGFLALLWMEEWRTGCRSVVYALGLSLMIVIVVGFVTNLVLPVLGMDRPLTFPPLALSILAVVGGMTVAVVRNREQEPVRLPVPELSPALLSLVLLPLLTVLAVEFLNVTGNTFPIIVALSVLAVTPLLLVTVYDSRWHGLGIWTLALAVLYHKSLWIYAGFPGSPGVVQTWANKRWNPGVTEVTSTSTDLLQNGILFPSYARLADVGIFTELEVVNPFLVAFIPFALFVTFREYTDSRKAVLGAAVFAFAHPFYLQYPTAGRAATPVLFLALFGVVMSDPDLSPVPRSELSLAFASGIIVSHYGTSYFVMVALIAAFGAYLLFQYVDDIVERLTTLLERVAHGQVTDRSVGSQVRSRTAFTFSLVLFYVVGAIAWYMYANAGAHFTFFPHLAKSISGLFGGGLFTGTTASRIQRSHGTNTTAIRLSKFVYLGLGGLMGVGLLLEHFRRFSPIHASEFDDVYLAVSTMMLATFGSTFVVDSWGGGRPMMITFAFTTIYAVVSVSWIVDSLPRAIRGWRSKPLPYPGKITTTGTRAFGVVLVVMLLLNTGVLSATVLGGFAPTNVATHDKLQESDNPQFRSRIHRFTDIATHVWLIDHMDESIQTRGSHTTRGMTDWYRPHIVGNTEDIQSYGDKNNKPRVAYQLLENGKPIPGYLLMMGHNLGMDVLWTYERKIEGVRDDDEKIRPYSKIYTTGESHVYHYENTSDTG